MTDNELYKDIIYLQNEDGEEDITWCEDRINKEDIAYFRWDIVEAKDIQIINLKKGLSVLDVRTEQLIKSQLLLGRFVIALTGCDGIGLINLSEEVKVFLNPDKSKAEVG